MRRKKFETVTLKGDSLYQTARIIAFGLTLALLGCSHDDGRIPERDLIPLLADLHIGEGYAQSPDATYGYSRDSIGVAILASRGYTLAQLDSTIGWYGRNLDDYAKLYVKVDAELDRRMKEISRRDGGSILDEDRQDLWPYNVYLRLTPSDMAHGFSFSLPVADLRPGDVLEWKVRNVESIQLDMLLGVEYDNGESRFLTSNVYGGKATGVSLQTDTASNVKRVFGLLRPYSSRFDRPILLDSISLQVSPVDSTHLYRLSQQRKYLLKSRPSKTASTDSSRMVSAKSDSINGKSLPHTGRPGSN